jgi:hypothetical protein
MKFGGTRTSGTHHSQSQSNGVLPERRGREAGSARPIVLGLALFLAGVGVSALLFYRSSSSTATQPTAETNAPGASTAARETPLTPTTLALLKSLASPVEIHFYSILDPATVPEAMKAFAGRAGHLLEQYQQQANGKIKLVSTDTPSDANARAAAADGVKAFNLEKGDACFLGIAVTCNKQKAALSQLSPDFEPALESDVTRAIQQVCESQLPGHAAPVATAAPDPEMIAAVKKAVTNIDAVSAEQGASIIRQANLDELAATVLDMETKIKAAESAYQQAETNHSEADQQAARAQIQQLQAEQAAKLKKLFAKTQAEVQAFQQLKAGH